MTVSPQERENVLRTLFPHRDPDSSPLILFGTGDVGVFLHGSLAFHGIPVEAFCDNDPGRQGGDCCGLPVLSLADIGSRHPDALFIVASHRYRGEMLDQLAAQGIPLDRISPWEAPARHGARYSFEEAGTIPGGTTGTEESPSPMTKDCLHPWNSLIVNAEGDVFPCCSASDLYIGNLFTPPGSEPLSARLETLLSSPPLQQLRQSLLTGSLRSMCRHCQGGVPPGQIPVRELADKVRDLLRGDPQAEGASTDMNDLSAAYRIRRMQIGPTSKCNLSCLYCPLSGKASAPGRAEMPNEVFLEMVDYAARSGMQRLDLWLDGEFTLYRNWADVCQRILARHPGLDLRLTSNFSRPFDAHELDVLSQLTQVSISCDTFDPSIYAFIRRRARLPVLRRNLEDLIQICKATGRSPRISLHAVLTDAVAFHLDEMVEYCLAQGIHLVIDNYQQFPGTRATVGGLLKSASELPPGDLARLHHILRDIRGRFERAGLECEFIGDVFERVAEAAQGASDPPARQ